VTTKRTPGECLTAELVQDGRRFALCLVKHLYENAGVAIFTEVTIENSRDGEPKHDIYQDVGTWAVDGGRDTEGGEDGPAEATPSVLKVDVMPSDDLSASEGAALMNQLIAQVGSEWSDSWQEWP